MALQLNFTDSATGATFSSSYWRVAEVLLSRRSQCATIHMLAFKDAAAASSKQPVATKTYVIEGTAFAAFRAAVIAGGAPNIEALAYAHVKATNEPGSGQSFFAGATDV